MLKPKIILIGGGGHCVAAIDVIELENKFEIIGILDVDEKKGDKVLDYEIIGNDNSLKKFNAKDVFFLITVGQIKSYLPRQKISQKLKNKNVAKIISPLAYVSKHACIDIGTIIMHNVVINAKATIGKHCIINTKSNIEHGAVIGDLCHISTGAIINGDTLVGNGSFIGSNATLSNNINIMKGSVVSAGKFIK